MYKEAVESRVYTPRMNNRSCQVNKAQVGNRADRLWLPLPSKLACHEARPSLWDLKQSVFGGVKAQVDVIACFDEIQDLLFSRRSRPNCTKSGTQIIHNTVLTSYGCIKTQTRLFLFVHYRSIYY